MIEMVAASPAHVRRIANRMGYWDRIECEAGGRSPLTALRLSLAGSVMAWTALVDRVPVAMWGAQSLSEIDGLGSPWMLGTDEARRHPRAFFEGGARTVPEMRSRFRRLENVVAVGNKPAIRLLARWGFMVGGPVMQRNGVDFVPFVMERHDV